MVTITGTVGHADGTLYSGSIQFKPLASPLQVGTVGVLTSPINVTVASDGTFTVDLYAGRYQVDHRLRAVAENLNGPMIIRVPNETATYDWWDLLESATPLPEFFGGLPDAGSGSVEGTAVLSAGETGGSKFLREDGDGTSSWQTISGGGNALTSSPLSQFAATTSAQLAGVISDETGTGALVFASSPTLVTPALGTPSAVVLTNATGTAAGLTAGNATLAAAATALATGRAINGVTFDGTAAITVTAAAGTLSGATLASEVTASSLTSAAGGTFGTAAFTAATDYATASHAHAASDITSGTMSTARLGSGTANSSTFLRGDQTYATPSATVEGTAVLSTGELGGSKFLREDGDGTSSWQAIGGGGDALTSSPLSQFAATTSSQLAGVISDETGSGALVFATSPTLVTPALGTPSALVGTNITGTAAGLTAGTASAVAVGGITGLGTGVATALAVNVGSAGAPVVLNGAGGTPSSLTLTNATGLPVAGGGTGRSTGTTAYALVATGTTATGAQQTLANGATTEVLVGGGASALPVWTTATGSGAPVRATSPTLTTPLLGTPTSGNLYSCTADGTNAVGFLHIPHNSQSTAYTCVLADAGKHILHPSADTTARTMTIPANSSVAYPVGAALTFINQASAGTMTISITTDTMRLAGAGTTGSRTLAANGIATAIKLTSTEWIISGTGLT